MGKTRVAKKFNKNFQEYMREAPSTSKQRLTFGFDRSITKKVKKLQRRIKNKSKNLATPNRLGAALPKRADIEEISETSSNHSNGYTPQVWTDNPVIVAASSTEKLPTPVPSPIAGVQEDVNIPESINETEYSAAVNSDHVAENSNRELVAENPKSDPRAENDGSNPRCENPNRNQSGDKAISDPVAGNSNTYSCTSEGVHTKDLKEIGSVVTTESDEDYLLITFEDSLFIEFDDEAVLDHHTGAGSTQTTITPANSAAGSIAVQTLENSSNLFEGLGGASSQIRQTTTGVRDSPITLDPKLEPFNSVLPDTEDGVSNLRPITLRDSNDSLDFLLDSINDETRYKCPFPGNPFNLYLLPKTPLIDVLRKMCFKEENSVVCGGAVKECSKEKTVNGVCNGQCQMKFESNNKEFNIKRKRSVDTNEGSLERNQSGRFEAEPSETRNWGNEVCTNHEHEDEDNMSKLMSTLKDTVEPKTVYLTLPQQMHSRGQTSKEAQNEQLQMNRWNNDDNDYKVKRQKSHDTNEGVTQVHHCGEFDAESSEKTTCLEIEIDVTDEDEKTRLKNILIEIFGAQGAGDPKFVYYKVPTRTVQNAHQNQGPEIATLTGKVSEAETKKKHLLLDFNTEDIKADKCDHDQHDTNGRGCNLCTVELLKKLDYIGPEINTSDIKVNIVVLEESQQQIPPEQAHDIKHTVDDTKLDGSKIATAWETRQNCNNLKSTTNVN